MKTVEAIIWTMKQGKTIELKYDDVIWTPNHVRKYSNKPKESYILKWIQEKQPGDVFTIDDFRKAYPNHSKEKKSRVVIDRTISELVKEVRITQLSNDGKFRVN